MGKKIYLQFYAQKFCLSKPVFGLRLKPGHNQLQRLAFLHMTSLATILSRENIKDADQTAHLCTDVQDGLPRKFFHLF